MIDYPIEQLWYTWSDEGSLGTGGFQVCAASEGIDLKSVYFAQTINEHLQYKLPPDIDPNTMTPNNAPISLSFINVGAEHLLIYKQYSGRDSFGRSGVFLAHLLAHLPPEFTALDAINLWQTSFLRNFNQSSNREQQLPRLSLESLKQFIVEQEHRFPLDLESIQCCLPLLLRAYFHKLSQPDQTESHIYLRSSSSQQIAYLIWALTQCLPRSWQHDLTFSTYELRTSSEWKKREDIPTIIGIYGGALVSEQQIDAYMLGNGTTIDDSSIIIDCYTATIVICQVKKSVCQITYHDAKRSQLIASAT